MGQELSKLIDLALPTPAECRADAESARRANPGADAHQCADYVIRRSRRICMAAGAATGAVANPVAMLPGAVADLGTVLYHEARIAGTVAALLHPSSLEDPEGLRTDILMILFPSVASQALRKAGVPVAKHLTKVAVRKYISKDVLKAIGRYSARYLGTRITQKAILTKSIPLVGALVGGSWNWVEVGRAGRRAVRYYEGA